MWGPLEAPGLPLKFILAAWNLLQALWALICIIGRGIFKLFGHLEAQSFTMLTSKERKTRLKNYGLNQSLQTNREQLGLLLTQYLTMNNGNHILEGKPLEMKELLLKQLAILKAH